MRHDPARLKLQIKALAIISGSVGLDIDASFVLPDRYGTGSRWRPCDVTKGLIEGFIKFSANRVDERTRCIRTQASHEHLWIIPFKSGHQKIVQTFTRFR